jgi:hypothetical protein
MRYTTMPTATTPPAVINAVPEFVDSELEDNYLE